jgi:hypothetical protein
MTKGLSYFITSDEGIIPKGVDDGRSRMTEASMPNGGGDGECGERRGGNGGGKRVEVAVLSQRSITRRLGISLTEKPRASNSIEQLLSRVN